MKSAAEKYLAKIAAEKKAQDDVEEKAMRKALGLEPADDDCSTSPSEDSSSDEEEDEKEGEDESVPAEQGSEASPSAEKGAEVEKEAAGESSAKDLFAEDDMVNFGSLGDFLGEQTLSLVDAFGEYKKKKKKRSSKSKTQEQQRRSLMELVRALRAEGDVMNCMGGRPGKGKKKELTAA